MDSSVRSGSYNSVLPLSYILSVPLQLPAPPLPSISPRPGVARACLLRGAYPEVEQCRQEEASARRYSIALPMKGPSSIPPTAGKRRRLESLRSFSYNHQPAQSRQGSDQSPRSSPGFKIKRLTVTPMRECIHALHAHSIAGKPSRNLQASPCLL